MGSKSKYYDGVAAVQVLGCLLAKPSLVEDGSQYVLREIDFDNNDFHRTMFGCIYNLINMGSETINAKSCEDYLQGKPKSLGIYKANKGAEWLVNTLKAAELNNFDYYYNRLKKMTLLKAYDDIGVDVGWFYDVDNIFDVDKKESQDEKLDQMTLEEVADEIDTKISGVREMVVDNSTDESCQIGDELSDLMESLKQEPARGYPLYDYYTDKVAMGARLGKLYLRSAGTGVGNKIAVLKSNL